jgi:hypothetical protein
MDADRFGDFLCTFFADRFGDFLCTFFGADRFGDFFFIVRNFFTRCVVAFRADAVYFFAGIGVRMKREIEGVLSYRNKKVDVDFFLLQQKS